MYVPHWPTKADYDEAIENLSNSILDRELQQGRAVTRSMLLQRRESPDRPVCLYSIDLPQGSRQMLRCFCQNDKEQHQLEQRFERYERLDKYQRQLTGIAAFVPITYIAQGIRVNCSLRKHDRRQRLASIVMPIVKMPFIRGRELGMYIAEYHENKGKMWQLCDRWWQMIDAMETIPMAHGDLDLTNVLVVEEDTLKLKLVDYDNIWIPGFELYAQPEHGHEHFQHPAFYAGERPYNAQMDRFSALVIYLSLLAITLKPELYKDYKVNEMRLLFSSYDYREESEHHTSAIGQLKRYNIAELMPFIDELCTSLHTARMPRRLSAIAAQPKPPHSDGPIIVPPKPPIVETQKKQPGRRVVIETDWSDADKFVRSNNSVSPSPVPSPLSPVHTPIPPVSTQDTTVEAHFAPTERVVPRASELLPTEKQAFPRHERPRQLLPAPPRQLAPKPQQERLILGSPDQSFSPQDATHMIKPLETRTPPSTETDKARIRNTIIGCLALLVIAAVLIEVLILLVNVLHL